MKTVAVCLAGCGVFDGSEIHESVITLLSIEAEGAQYQCVAPDIQQHHVINHLTQEVVAGETRSVLQESARIARGEIKTTNEINVSDFDALVLPGGFGAAKNLCNFALAGPEHQVHEAVAALVSAFREQGKPVGFICISPAMIGKLYPEGTHATLGQSKEMAEAMTAMGTHHVDCSPSDCVVDKAQKVVSTPAYMEATSLLELQSGIGKLVKEVLALT